MAISPTDRYVSEREAAEVLGVAPGTLAVWRCTRRVALPYRKFGAAVRYSLRELEQFADASRVDPCGAAQR